MLLHIIGFPSVLKLNNISLYVYTVSLFQSSVYSCFHFLAIVNTPSRNLGVQKHYIKDQQVYEKSLNTTKEM